jgi:hypothetical protein
LSASINSCPGVVFPALLSRNLSRIICCVTARAADAGIAYPPHDESLGSQRTTAPLSAAFLMPLIGSAGPQH